MTRASHAGADTAFSLLPQAAPTVFSSLVPALTDLGDYNHTRHSNASSSSSAPPPANSSSEFSRAATTATNNNLALPHHLSGSGRDGQLEDVFILCVLAGFAICMCCLCTYAVICRTCPEEFEDNFSWVQCCRRLAISIQRIVCCRWKDIEREKDEEEAQLERERQRIEQRAFACRSSRDPTTRTRPHVGGAGLAEDLAAPTHAMLDDHAEMEARAASQRATMRESDDGLAYQPTPGGCGTSGTHDWQTGTAIGRRVKRASLASRQAACNYGGGKYDDSPPAFG